jgi:hypothetical protein
MPSMAVLECNLKSTRLLGRHRLDPNFRMAVKKGGLGHALNADFDAWEEKV